MRNNTPGSSLLISHSASEISLLLLLFLLSPSSPFSLCKHVYLRVFIVCVRCMHTCMWRPGGHPISCSIIVLYSLVSRSVNTPKLGWEPANPRNPPVMPQHQVYRHTQNHPSFACGCWGSKLKPSCLHSKLSDSLNHLPSP